MPEVSVIVPARNAGATISRLFAALDDQTWDGSWEVVVVDDASTDDTADLAAAWGARVVRLETQSGPAQARNAGLATGAAPLIAFTDADCEPCPEWLAAIHAASSEAEIITGPVVPAPGPAAGPFARTLRITCESALYETANLAVTRAVAEQVGGFEAFAPDAGERRPGLRPRVGEGHFGEDAVFGWRARRAGARTTFVEAALVHHAVFPRGPKGYIAERWRLRYFPTLVREVPELRSRLPLRMFLSERSALFDLAVLSVLLTSFTSQRPWLLGVLPYALRHLRRGPPWRRSVVRQNLALVAGDALALAALTRGSAAARTFLL